MSTKTVTKSPNTVFTITVTGVKGCIPSSDVIKDNGGTKSLTIGTKTESSTAFTYLPGTSNVQDRLVTEDELRAATHTAVSRTYTVQVTTPSDTPTSTDSINYKTDMVKCNCRFNYCSPDVTTSSSDRISDIIKTAQCIKGDETTYTQYSYKTAYFNFGTSIGTIPYTSIWGNAPTGYVFSSWDIFNGEGTLIYPNADTGFTIPDANIFDTSDTGYSCTLYAIPVFVAEPEPTPTTYTVNIDYDEDTSDEPVIS